MTTRALVLSGGGPVGIAWESGLIGGLAVGGLDVSKADFIMGTSAGAFVGSLLARGTTPARLAAPFLAMDEAAPPPLPASEAKPAASAPPNTSEMWLRMERARNAGKSPQEVDNEVTNHPAVRDVCTIGVPNEEWGEEVKSVVALHPGFEPSDALAKELIAYAKANLAGFKVPRSIDFADDIPRSEAGKVQRRQVRAPYWAGRVKQI